MIPILPRLSILLLLTLPAMLPAALRAEETPQVVVEIERERIYEGESVLYRVTVANVQNPAEPTLAGFDDIDIATLAQQSLDSTSIVIINGQQTVNTRRGRQFNYRLTPKHAGEFLLPGPTVDVGGQTLRGREVSLKVVAPDDQDLVRMKIAIEPESVYPMQPFKVKLTVAVKSLPDPMGDRNPVAVQSDPPALSIPWADDRQVHDGLEPQTDLNRWLGPLENERGAGFSINDLGGNSIFAMFENRRIAFLPKPEKIRMADRSGREAVYWQFEFSRTFTPKRIGEFSFGPVSLKGQFAAKADEERGLLGEHIYAVAKAVSLTVKDVPRDGRPESYIGAVGRFSLSAELTPHKVKTGDPMTLVLSLRGEGTLDSAAAPDLTKIPAIAKSFKLYDATEQTKPGLRRFTYALRPTTAELKEFPAIEASYFDVASERFETLRTEPVRIEIAPADKLAGRDIVASPSNLPPGGKEIETRTEGIYANAADFARLSDQSIRPAAWTACWGGMIAAYSFLFFGVSYARRIGGDSARVRRVSAAKNARRSMKLGLKRLASGQGRGAAEAIEEALLNFIADWTDAPSAGMTSAEACRILTLLEIPVETIAAAKNCLESCEALRFGGSAQSLDTLRHNAEEILERLIAALKKSKRRAKS
jgi:hypothetical protein